MPIPAWCWHITPPFLLVCFTTCVTDTAYGVRARNSSFWESVAVKSSVKLWTDAPYDSSKARDSGRIITIAIILGTVHCVKYMTLSVKRPCHYNWHLPSFYVTVINSISPRKETPRLGKVLVLLFKVRLVYGTNERNLLHCLHIVETTVALQGQKSQ